MVEVINGVIIEDPHKINGIDQMPKNGFEKNWGGWSDIKAMVKIAKFFVDKKLRKPNAKCIEFEGEWNDVPCNADFDNVFVCEKDGKANMIKHVASLFFA